MSILTTETAATSLLRFATAGSVDDGKSTLVGRLLHDSKSVLADQLEAVEAASRNRGQDIPSIADASLVDAYRFMVLEMSEDKAEAHEAWRQRRKANFRGR